MSSTALKDKPQSHRRRLVQISIWVLFAAVLFTAFKFSAAHHASTYAAQPQQTTLADGSGSSSTGGQSMANNPTIQGIWKCNLAGHKSSTCKDPTYFLPAFRWKNTINMYTSLGVGGSLKPDNLLSILAGAIFSCASFLWGILLDVVSFALDTDLVRTAGATIDGVFAATGKALGGSGLPIIAILFAAFLGAMRVLRGRLNEAVSLILTGVIILGGLSALTAAASHEKKGQALHVGSPAWIAVTGNGWINQVAVNVTNAFGAANAVVGTNSAGGEDAGTGGPTCATYLRNLYATFTDVTKKVGNSNQDPNKTLTGSALMQVSNMWLRSFYDNETIANGGNVLPNGARMECHFLEYSLGTPEMEQFAMVGGHGHTSKATSPGYRGMSDGPFFNFDEGGLDEKDKSVTWASMFAWAACHGELKPAHGWAQSMNTTPDQRVRQGKDGDVKTDINGKEARGTENCYNWWNYHVNPDKLKGRADIKGINYTEGTQVFAWSDRESMHEQTTWNGKPASADDERSWKDALYSTRQTADGYWGYNSGNRLFAGLSSLISGGLSLWALGVTAAGTIVTQIALVFLLCLLPFTLVLLAFPGRNGSRNGAGVKMLKTTLSFMGGKLVFLGLLSATVELMSILWGVTSAIAGPDSTGWFELWSLVVPIATILIMKMLMKSLGMGNVMSLSGAAGFATKAALSATTDGKRTRDKMNARDARSSSALKSARNRMAARALGAKAPDGGKSMSNRQLARSVLDKRRSKAQGGLAAYQAGEAMRAGGLSPKLAAAVASGAMTMEQAKALHSGRVAEDFLKPWQQGRITRQQAEQLTSQKKAYDEQRKRTTAAEGTGAAGAAGLSFSKDGKAAALDGSPYASKGGFEASMGRLTSAADASLEGVGPVLGNVALNADASRSSLTAARTEVNGVISERLKGADGDQWGGVMVAETLASVEALRAGGQHVAVGQGRALTAGEVKFETSRVAQANDLPESWVMVGESGLPHTTVPVTRDASGAFQWPTNLSDNQLLTLVLSGSNYVDDTAPAGATLSEMHMRNVLKQYEASLIDDQGKSAMIDVLKAEGLDPSTVAGRELIIKGVRGEAPAVAAKLNSITFKTPANAQRAIDIVIDQYAPAVADRTLQSQSELAYSVDTLSRQVQQRAQEEADRIGSQIDDLLASASFPAQGPEIERTLRYVETYAPQVWSDLGAATFEADMTTRYFDSGKLDIDAAAHYAEKGNEATAEFSRQVHELTGRVLAELRNSNEDRARHELQALRDRFAEEVEESSRDLERRVEDLNRAMTREVEIHAQHSAGQMRAPLRGSDFAAGADDLAWG